MVETYLLTDGTVIYLTKEKLDLISYEITYEEFMHE